MKASAIEFRLRMLIQIVIVTIAMWAPWVRPWDWGKRLSTLEWLALEISRTGLVSFTVSTPIVILFGVLLAACGMVLRVWGAAYLGYDVVHHGDMQAGAVMAAGPYRYMRNPLYLGGWCMMAAISLLLTPSGALLMVVLIGIFYLRLVLGEEAFLNEKLGEPYRTYLRAVPRILPQLRAGLPSSDAKPHWVIAALTEIMPIGVFLTMAIVSWTYDNQTMLLGILISFLASMLVRGLMKDLIPALVFIVIAPAVWGSFHLSIVRSGLIAFGASLVVHALMSGIKQKPSPQK
jgi:protein-S-isoprenylcysteine O-methyltransferase Ste14